MIFRLEKFQLQFAEDKLRSLDEALLKSFSEFRSEARIV